ncbi:MAG: hypothetical protein JST05_06735 [Acidobacteria bacterium]|nr:hypothetical protein [Acidobacteriota bacterium]
MEMLRHSIRLHGPAAKKGRGSSLVLSQVLPFLVQGTQQSLRLRIEGRSRAKGSLPAALRKASDFEFVGFGSKSGVLEFEAPQLSQVLPKEDQPRLFPLDLDMNRSALYLLEESLEDALNLNLDSDRLDEGLIQTFEKDLAKLFHEVEAIEMANGKALKLNEDSLKQFHEFKRETPPKQWVKIAGKLEVIRHTDRAFAIQLDDGVAIRGVAEGFEAEDLAGLFGKKTLIEGHAVFRPSGNLLRIEAQKIELAQGDTQVWSQIPRPLFASMDLRALQQHQGPKSGFNALIGKWPGEEADEEIEAQLETIS